MKTTNILILFLILASLSLLAQGCYTQLATTEEAEEYYPSEYSEPLADAPDSTYQEDMEEPYDYDYPRYRYWVGFGYYSPSWGIGWGYDPYYSDFYYDPWYYPYRWSYFGSYYSPYHSPYYGYWNPYYYYNRYPVIVYGDGRVSRTRESGYRRTGSTRRDEVFGRNGAGTHSSITIPTGSRTAGGRGGYSAPAPSSRKAESAAGRGVTRGKSHSGSRSREASVGRTGSSGRSGSPSARPAPSSGGSNRSGTRSGGSRSSGTSRGRNNISNIPTFPRESYRVDPGSIRRVDPGPGVSVTPASRSSFRPSYNVAPPSNSGYSNPGYSNSGSSSYSAPRSSSPAPSGRPASSSGGGSSNSGGNRSSGATRSR